MQQQQIDMYEANERLAYKIAQDLIRAIKIPRQYMDDVMQDARQGLWEAVLRYKPETGYQFSTFAYYTIRGIILRGFRLCSGYKSYHVDKNRQEPDFKIIPMTDAWDEEKGKTIGEFSGEVYEDELETEDTVDNLLSVLDSRERYCITQYYLQKKKYGDIGKTLDLSRERVRQIINQSILKIKDDVGILTPAEKRCIGHFSHREMVTYKGQTMSVSDWAIKLNISKETLSRRLGTGMSAEEAFTKKVNTKPAFQYRKSYTYGNKTQSLRAWAREKKMPHATLYYRIARGWTIKKALTTPIDTERGRRPKHVVA